ncbi:hypothetical protein [Baaleninema sp.]|uniref:hypothetical protein n=1 Tax=Baaleninema sp. TaxID=3101197 RepID=UPI003CFF6CC5
MSGFQLQWELPREASNEFDLPLDLHSLHVAVAPVPEASIRKPSFLIFVAALMSRS